MTKCLVASVANLEARDFTGLKIRFFDTPGCWPVSVAHEIIPANGGEMPFITHKKTGEFVFILEGKAKLCLGNRRYAIQKSDYILIPPGVKHRFLTGKKPLVAISVFCPAMTFKNLDAVPNWTTKRRKANA